MPTGELAGGQVVVLEEEVLDGVLFAAVTTREVVTGALGDRLVVGTLLGLPFGEREHGHGHPAKIGQDDGVRVRGVVAVIGVALALTACSAGDTAAPEATPRPTSASSGATPATPDPTETTTVAATPDPAITAARVYVALGDSLTAGYQRSTGDAKDAAYPALLAEDLAARGIDLTVTNLACTGETSSELIDGGRCLAAPSQLGRAEGTIADAGDRLALVTVFIGANDVLRCLGTGGADRACLDRAGTTLDSTLATIFGRLRSAADEAAPGVPVVALTYFDPFSQSIAGQASPADLRAVSAAGADRLNASIAAAAQAHGVLVVDIRDLLEGPDGSALCTMTSVCANGDFHFNAASNVAVASRLREVVEPLLVN